MRYSVATIDLYLLFKEALLSPFSPEKDQVKIIANLPFNVGTHLMLKWLRMIPNKQGPFVYGIVF